MKRPQFSLRTLLLLTMLCALLLPTAIAAYREWKREPSPLELFERHYKPTDWGPPVVYPQVPEVGCPIVRHVEDSSDSSGRKPKLSSLD